MNAKIENINGITNITKKKGVPLKILQLTDIHIGGSFSTRKKDKLALQAVEKIVNASDADFVIVTGDMVYPIPWLLQGSFNNLKSSKKFAACMENSENPGRWFSAITTAKSGRRQARKKSAIFILRARIVIFPTATKT